MNPQDLDLKLLGSTGSFVLLMFRQKVWQDHGYKNIHIRLFGNDKNDRVTMSHWAHVLMGSSGGINICHFTIVLSFDVYLDIRAISCIVNIIFAP